MADLSELNFYLSGGSVGAANTDTTKSTGGVLTTTKILSQLAVYKAGTTALPGVALGDAQGNTPGTGVLTLTVSGAVKTLRFTPPNGSIGTAVDVSANGTYSIQGANNGGAVDVTVTAASLPAVSTTAQLTITQQKLKVFDSVTKAQSLAGLTEYRCIYVKNDGTTLVDDDKINLELYFSKLPTGADVITMGLATEAPSTGAGVAGVDYPADTTAEGTAPAGITFSSPTVDAPLTAFNLSSTAGTSYAKAFWIKREVPANTDVETLDDTWEISCKVKF